MDFHSPTISISRKEIFWILRVKHSLLEVTEAGQATEKGGCCWQGSTTLAKRGQLVAAGVCLRSGKRLSPLLYLDTCF